MSEKREMMTSTIQETARYVVAQHAYHGLEINELSLSMWLAFTSSVSGFDLLVTDTNGIVTACSARNVMHHGMQIPEGVIRDAIPGGQNIRVASMGEVYSEPRHVVGVPLTRGMGAETILLGYMFVSSDMATLHSDWQVFSLMFAIISIFVMAIAVSITFFATTKVVRPLDEVASAARKFARGDFSVRIEGSGRNDEIGQLTQAFNNMAENLEASEKLKREFISNISHELKTPLTVISGFAEGLSDGTIPPEKEKRYLGVISSEARRLSRLIKGMLEMSSIESGGANYAKESKFDITEVVRLSLLNLGRKIEGRQLDVEADLPEEAVITQGDGDAITQVVYNLIDNAIKFSPQGGTLKVELWKQGALVYVAIENQGDCISKDELPLIFDKFHKTDKSRSVDKEGVGLGLYIVKTILNNHNQDIYVESHDGFTRFIFTLAIVK